MSKLSYAYTVPDGGVLAIGRSLAGCMSNARKVATLQGVDLASFKGSIMPFDTDAQAPRIVAGRVKLTRTAAAVAPPAPRKRKR